MVVWLGWFLIVTMGSGFNWFWCCLIGGFGGWVSGYDGCWIVV